MDVFGLRIYATNTTGDDKLLHAASVLAEYIDNDEDAVPDNPEIMKALLEGKGAIVIVILLTSGTKTGIGCNLRPKKAYIHLILVGIGLAGVVDFSAGLNVLLENCCGFFSEDVSSYGYSATFQGFGPVIEFWAFVESYASGVFVACAAY